MEFSPWIASRAYSEAAYSRTSPALRPDTFRHRFLHRHGSRRAAKPDQHLD